VRNQKRQEFIHPPLRNLKGCDDRKLTHVASFVGLTARRPKPGPTPEGQKAEKNLTNERPPLLPCFGMPPILAREVSRLK
jgi:hypothetical protein